MVRANNNKTIRKRGSSKRGKSCGCNKRGGGRGRRGGVGMGLGVILKDLAVPAGLFYTQKMLQRRRSGSRKNGSNNNGSKKNRRKYRKHRKN